MNELAASRMTRVIERLRELFGAPTAGRSAPGGAPSVPRMSEIVHSHAMERSILHAANVADFVPYAVSGRMRRATCSGVAWFRDYHLAVVNLYGGHLRVYRFHPGGVVSPARLELLHELSDGIEFPEDVAVSPDGNLLAVSHSLSKEFGVSLFRMDATSLAPIPAREKIRPGAEGVAFHGVSFSPDSRHLVFTEISTPGYIEVVRVASATRERTCFIENRLAPLKPKSVAFSHDGRFAAVTMALNAFLGSQAPPTTGIVSVHRFDAANGVIDAQAVAEFKAPAIDLASMDICKFLPTAPGEPYRILVVDQGADAITLFEFDAEDRTIAPAGVFAGGLSFPHGIDVSTDGRFVAMTNYGDDSVCIARLAPSIISAGERAPA
jgi:hypothetical protein